MNRPKLHPIHTFIMIGVAFYFIIMQQIAPSVRTAEGREFIGYLTMVLLALALTSIVRMLQVSYRRWKRQKTDT